MFGIGGAEFVLIIFIVLMLFGSDKIPEIARNMGKIMKQVKNATNDIKSEIQKSAENNGLDVKSVTGGISEEIEKTKQDITDAVKGGQNPVTDFTTQIKESKEDIETITGPIKRQF